MYELSVFGRFGMTIKHPMKKIKLVVEYLILKVRRRAIRSCKCDSYLFIDCIQTKKLVCVTLKRAQDQKQDYD